MRAESVQQETAGNCQQGCGIKHKTISQQLVANIFGIECELKRAEGGATKGGTDGGRQRSALLAAKWLCSSLCLSNIGSTSSIDNDAL